MLRRLKRAFPAKLSFDALEDGFIPSLEGLRGLAILLVIGFHYLRSYFPIGWAGVDLFFVLSGFLITRILLRAKEDKPTGKLYFRDFYARRVLRIFPLYYVSLVLILFVLPLIFGAWYHEKLAFYTQNQGWFWTYMANWLYAFRGWGESTLLSHFWSLALEEQFYFFWPFLVYFLRPRQLIGCALGMVIMSLVLRNIYYGAEGMSLFTYNATFCRLDTLGLGALLAILLSKDAPLLKRAAVPAFVISGVILCIAVIGFKATDYRNEFSARAGYTLNAIFFSSLLLIALSNHPGNVFHRVFSTPVMRWFGKYSYGLYVIHYPAYYLVEAYKYYPTHTLDSLSKIGTVTAAVLITIPLTLLSYRFLELPFLRLKRYFD
jgi:peptidoglycan/LPS O-acetylase OafA/YrhL